MGKGDGSKAAWVKRIYIAHRVNSTSNQLIGELAQMVERLLSKGLVYELGPRYAEGSEIDAYILHSFAGFDSIFCWRIFD